MSLTKQLKERATQSAAKYPQTIHKIMNNGIDVVRKIQSITPSLKTGDTIPEIKLPNAANQSISVQDVLQHNKVILSFYRGGWCPYCNMELRALQKSQDEFKKLGATLIAISPETPDNSITTKEKNELRFEVLSDIDNTIAKAFNLAFTLPKDLQEVYKGFGIDLEKNNGNQNHQLPISATYIIGQDNTIVYDFTKEDYKERADPQEIINFLKNN